jgi:perosamine synthetase
VLLLTCTRDEFSAALDAEGINNSAGYIPKPVYMQPLLQNKQAYPGSHYPFDLSDVSYDEGLCPVAENILKTAIKMPVSEFFTLRDIEDMIAGVRKVALHFAK